jgi:serine/threonine protein kinase
LPSERACLADIDQGAPNDLEPVVVSDPWKAWSSSTTERKALGMKWHAPELISRKGDDAEKPKTPATDVYAFGMVCYEVRKLSSFTGSIGDHSYDRCFLANFLFRIGAMTVTSSSTYC